MSRAIVSVIAGATLLLAISDNARADDPPDSATCRKAYEQGQRLRRSKRLLDARSEFLLCARDPCPTVFQPECAKWLDEVEEEMPSVVIVFEGLSNETRPGEVVVDGIGFADTVDGLARPLDPGPHEVRVRLGQSEIVRRVTVVEGIKAQRLVFALPPKPPAQLQPARPRLSPVTVLLGSFGILGLVGFTYFGARGLLERSDVEHCTPNCSQTLVNDARRNFLIADISLGVSVVALSLATYLYFSRSSLPRASSARSWALPW